MGQREDEPQQSLSDAAAAGAFVDREACEAQDRNRIGGQALAFGFG